jgi:hypothetical protein
MRPRRILANAAICIVLTGTITTVRVSGQIYDQCPAGYYFDPNYGCLPLSYFYGPPTVTYPYPGFGFFYGGNWSRGAPPGYYRGGGHPGGGVHAGGAVHMGGGHPGGGGGHGGH